MATFFDHIPEKQQKFIEKQKMFFIASAPTEGRLNLSPKGLDTFRILDANTVAYLDLTGSGNETAAHLQENQRATVMFCSFDKSPNILRLYCKGEVINCRDARWDNLIGLFPQRPGIRQIICLHVEQVQTSCGFAVPHYTFAGERETLDAYSGKLDREGLEDYWARKNRKSIDGLPTPEITWTSNG